MLKREPALAYNVQFHLNHKFVLTFYTQQAVGMPKHFLGARSQTHTTRAPASRLVKLSSLPNILKYQLIREQGTHLRSRP